MRAVVGLALMAVLVAAPLCPQDAILEAMGIELERSRALRIVDLDEPYFIQYGLEDARSFGVTASLGATISRNERHFRVPSVEVRVGGYEFDNTNYVYSDYFTAGVTRGALVPLDNDRLVLRNFLWLATDRAYKGAVEAIARKRAALKNVTVGESLPDLSKAEAVTRILELKPTKLDKTLWESTARKLSALFAKHEKAMWSTVQFEHVQSTSYLANSEGTRLRYPDDLTYVRIRAQGQAPDGMMIRDAATAPAHSLESMPSELDLERLAEQVAENVSALVDASAGDTYVGPVLIEGIASAQLFAQVLGSELAIPRRPVTEPGRPSAFTASRLEGRIGSRILPDWISVVDDPTQTEWRGRPLFGHYQVDTEGVAPAPLLLVENGVLKNYLLTRQPIKGQEGSNGRARLPGRNGAKLASFGNLFVNASETVPTEELRKQLIELCGQRGKDYGIIIRRLDFPSSAGVSELRRMTGGRRRGGSTPRLVSAPILVYRLYTDGTEELVRGLRFRGLNVRSLRDIIAASDESHQLDFMGNSAPLSMMGAGGFVTANTVVAPSVLFAELERERVEEGLPKLPVVPAPELTVGGPRG
ncbi:MAG: hypothetical protein GY953_32085 [bacterium]|nr:hypothetical protein [bacterium]